MSISLTHRLIRRWTRIKTAQFYAWQRAGGCWCGGHLGSSRSPFVGDCLECGTGVLRHRLTEASYERWYASGTYRRWQMGTADVSAAQLAKEIRRAESAFRFLSEYGVYVSGKRVVDVGSGAGGALVVAKLFGAKTVLGVDTDARSWAIPETFGIRVMNRLPVERNWDLVVCSHLIEHVLRPVEVLRTLGLYLASGGYGNPPGYLYVETPAWGPKAEVKLPHPYMYSEKSFRLLAKRAGLSVVAMTDGIQAMLRRAT